MFIGDYWHIAALAILCCIISLSLNNIIVLILFYCWLIVLYFYKKVPFKLVMVTILVGLIFMNYLPNSTTTVNEHEFENELMAVKGKIKSPIKETDKIIEFEFEKDDGENLLVVYFKNEEIHIRHTLGYGANCTLYGEHKTPDKATNPHQFEYQSYLSQKGISSQFILQTLQETNCTSASSLSIIFSVRNDLLQLTKTKLQDDTTKWLHALVLGDDSLLEQSLIDVFQRWGLSHILAISGLHIGIVVSLLYLVFLRFSLITKEKAQIFILLFLPVYAILAGGQPSVWRASLMVLLVIFISFLKWKMTYTDVLSIVFILLIILDKYIVFHIGFQLSFAVTFGIILSRKWLTQSNSFMESLFKISFVSQMMILPLQLHYFSIFEPLSILLNVIIVPYFSLFVIPVMFIFMFSTLLLPAPILKVMEFIFHLIHNQVINFLMWMDQHLHYPFIIGKLTLYFVVVYYIIFIFMMIYLERKQQMKAFQYGIILCFYIAFLALRPYLSPYGTVTMLDIGQGDALVIELPYRKGVFFVDAGASATFPNYEVSDKVYRQVIRPYLLGQGIWKIDAIFISHEDLDHNGSVSYLIEDMRVDEIIISPFYSDEEKQQQWTNLDLTVQRVNFNERVLRNSQDFYVLSPKKDTNSTNENSLVLYTELGGLNWLFPGDIGKDTEKEIIKTYPNLTFDVLKVAHHGSNTSSSSQLVEQTSKYAFISVGGDNSYGHPTKEVIDTLKEQQLKIYRTDKDGAVQYHFKGENGIFVPYLKND